MTHRAPQLRRCHDCGAPLAKKAIFCPRCGARQPPDRVRDTTGR